MMTFALGVTIKLAFGTAIHILKGTAFYGKGDVTASAIRIFFHFGMVAAAIKVIHMQSLTTIDGSSHVTRNIGVVTTTEDFCNIFLTGVA